MGKMVVLGLNAVLLLISASVSAFEFEVFTREKYPTKILEGIQSAQRSIDFMQFAFYTESGIPHIVTRKLIAKKNENPEIRIRVFLEGSNPVSSDRNQDTAKLLTEAGIEVFFDEASRLDNAAAICFDETKLLVASKNRSNTFNINNNDSIFYIESEPIAHGFTDFMNRVISDPNEPFRSEVEHQGIRFLTDTIDTDEVTGLILSARKSIDLSLSLTEGWDKRSTEELLNALTNARKRKIEVRIILDGKEDNTLSNYLVVDSSTVLLGSQSAFTKNPLEYRHLNLLISDAQFGQKISSFHSQKIAYGAKRQAPQHLGLFIGTPAYFMSEPILAKRIAKEQLPQAVLAGENRGLSALFSVMVDGENIPYPFRQIVLAVYDNGLYERAIEDNPIGRNVVAFNSEIFSAESTQNIPTLFNGSVHPGKAYFAVERQDYDWQKSSSYFSFYTRKPNNTDADYYSSIDRFFVHLQTHFGQSEGNAVIFVSRDYVLLFETRPSLEAFNTDRGNSAWLLITEKMDLKQHGLLKPIDEISDLKLRYGEGISLQFDAEIPSNCRPYLQF